LVREGMALSRKLGLRTYDGYHAGNGSGTAERLGEWAWIRQAIGELAEADPDRREFEWLAACRDTTSAWTGDPDLARGERLVAQAVAESDFQTELNASGWLANCAFAAGRLDDAVRYCEPLLRHAETDAALGGEIMAARIAIHAGRLDLARRVLAAINLSEGGVADFDVTTIRAGIAAQEGQVGDALALYRSALAGYREAGCRFDVALVILDMTVLIGPGEPAVGALIPDGRAILEDLGARSLVARLDAAESSASRPDGRAATVAQTQGSIASAVGGASSDQAPG